MDTLREHEAALKAAISPTDLLSRHVNERSINGVAADVFDFDVNAPAEVLLMLVALLELADSTEEHAKQESAEGFTLSAEETFQRAAKYRESYNALRRIWE